MHHCICWDRDQVRGSKSVHLRKTGFEVLRAHGSIGEGLQDSSGVRRVLSRESVERTSAKKRLDFLCETFVSDSPSVPNLVHTPHDTAPVRDAQNSPGVHTDESPASLSVPICLPPRDFRCRLFNRIGRRFQTKNQIEVHRLLPAGRSRVPRDLAVGTVYGTTEYRAKSAAKPGEYPR